MPHTGYRWNTSVRSIALLGNHLPRRCGIATFTTDLADALATERMGIDCTVVAMNEPGRAYDYPERVRCQIGEGEAAHYRSAADFLNVNGVEVVSLQHEYGIFGGKAGALLLDFLRDVRMPVVSTLHTILAEPSAEQRCVMDEILALSTRVVVMSASGRDLLETAHGIDPAKIDVIPHGIPVVPQNTGSKDVLGLSGHDVILTFGLLSRDKGLEYVIDALPAILAERPNALYVVVGVTHPHVKEEAGEEYRLMLESRAKRLGVDGSIVFHDRFVSQAELVQFLAAADIYVTPYLNMEQITSGTLAQAVGAGKAVISTPYRYAKELLDGGRGLLVPMRDPAAIARAALEVLTDTAKRRGLEARASAYGHTMTWPVVARAYLASFERARAQTNGLRSAGLHARTLAARSPAATLPEVDLAHLLTLTDDTAILQHATFDVPRRADGYCLDDNARALLLTTLLEEHAVALQPARTVRTLASRYLAFVDHAFDPATGGFHNLMSYSREWQDDSGLPISSRDDCHGRALWALGAVAARSSDRALTGLARRLWHAALPRAEALTSPRAWAYALLGLDDWLRAEGGDEVARRMMVLLSDRLLARWHATHTTEWPWFEDRLAYDNARLPQALMVAGARLRNPEARSVATTALDWLCAMQSRAGAFAPIGSDGFWIRDGKRAAFDQQPIEAAATIGACIEAHRVTGNVSWLASAKAAFDWFLGKNDLALPLYDAATRGCRDGLHCDRVNENQGAESTLSFLTALVEMHGAERMAASMRAPPPSGELAREQVAS